MTGNHRYVYGAFRLGQCISAVTVVGLVATATLDMKFYYIISVSVLSAVLAVLWLWPFEKLIVHFLTDIVLFITWIVAFGILGEYIKPMSCGSIWAWSDIIKGGTCAHWKAAVAFSFLSAGFWVITALTGMVYMFGSKAERPPLSSFWRTKTLYSKAYWEKQQGYDQQSYDQQNPQ